MAGKLPVFTTTSEAWRSTREALSAMPVLSLIAAVLMFVLAIVQIAGDRFILNPSDIASAHALGSKAMLFNFIMAMVQAALLAPFAIAVHRFVLLGERAGGYGLDPSSPRYRRFVAFSLLMTLMWFVPGGLELVAGASGSGLYGSFLFLVLLIALFVVMTIGFVRLSVVLPAAALDAADAEWRDAWALTRGNFWRIIGVVFCTVLPVMLPMTLLTLFFIGIIQAAGIVALVLFALVWGAGLLLTTTAAIAALSHIYRRLHAPLA